MAVKKKWYAVRSGRKTGVFATWAECKKQTDGYPNAVFRGFFTKEEAEKFLSGDTLAEDVPPAPDKKTAIAYVDGSFDPSIKGTYSFGVVFIYGGVIRTYSRRIEDPSLAEMRNVAGEISGAMFAMRLCLQQNIPQLELYYDYAGIEKWCVGEWRPGTAGTKQYKDFYDCIRGDLSVRFHKVASHTGVTYNELADQLAKEALYGKETPMTIVALGQ